MDAEPRLEPRARAAGSGKREEGSVKARGVQRRERASKLAARRQALKRLGSFGPGRAGARHASLQRWMPSRGFSRGKRGRPTSVIPSPAGARNPLPPSPGRLGRRELASKLAARRQALKRLGSFGPGLAGARHASLQRWMPSRGFNRGKRDRLRASCRDPASTPPSRNEKRERAPDRPRLPSSLFPLPFISVPSSTTVVFTPRPRCLPRAWCGRAWPRARRRCWRSSRRRGSPGRRGSGRC